MLNTIRHYAFIVLLSLTCFTTKASVFSLEEKSFISYILKVVSKASSNTQSFVYPWVVCQDAQKSKKATFISGPLFSPSNRSATREKSVMRWLGSLITEANRIGVDFALCSLQIDHFDVCVSQAAFTITFEKSYLVGYEEIFSNHSCEI